MKLDPADLRAYARRDWSALEARSRRARAALPPAQKVAVAIALYESARATLPGWPTEADRRRDLQDTLRLRRLLDRASHVGAR